ncbi:MAG: hypothetical protein KJ626_06925 [Verrucomicrobia bacterium]|nr:hypothetical protein [Verrucomicrobiota bacterium]
MKPRQQVIAFAGIGVLLFSVLYFLAEHFAPPYPLHKTRLKMLVERGDTIEALSIGSSHSQALRFEFLGVDGIHTWQAGNDIFEMRYQAESVLPKMPGLKTVFWCVSPRTFHLDNLALSTEDRSELRRRYYATMPGWKFIPGDGRDLFRAMLTPIVRIDHWAEVVMDFLMRREPTQYVQPGGLIANVPEKRGKEQEAESDAQEEDQSKSRYATEEHKAYLEKHADHRVSKLNEQIADMLLNRPDLEDKAFEAAEDIIEMFQKRGVRVIAYTPPYYEKYTELFDPALIEDMDRKMALLQKKYGFEYYDMSRDEEFIHRPELFINSDHVSGEGAGEVSKKLKRLIDAEAPTPKGD